MTEWEISGSYSDPFESPSVEAPAPESESWSGLPSPAAALFSAVIRRDANATEDLLLAEVDPNARLADTLETPLFLAVEGGWVEGVELLLEHGADANARDADGDSPLFVALRSGLESAYDIVGLLVDHGADANARGSGNTTALTIAVAAGDEELVETLLDHGADANQAGAGGYSPLAVAESQKLDDIAALLIRYGASVPAESGNVVGKINS